MGRVVFFHYLGFIGVWFVLFMFGLKIGDIMSQMFQIEIKDFINLRKFYKRAPRKFQRVAAGVLNNFAWGTKKSAIAVINEEMTVRNKRFVESSFRVKNANANTDLNSMVSRVGSIERPRFSGWEEQQTGKKRESTRVGTLLSRGKNMSKQIRPAARMKAGRNFPDAGDYEGKSEQQRTMVMLNTLKRKKFRKPFVIRRKLRKFVPGLYKFFRGKVKMLQRFDSKKAQPKKIDWMGEARRDYFRAHPVRETWGKAIKHVLKLR